MADFLNFKKGLLANLEGAAKQAGTIYVTTDERAMYVDVDNNTRIRLGDFIEVATEADLGLAKYQPYSTTALYYITEGNKLMKYSGVADGSAVFVQINSTKAVNDLVTALTERVDAVETKATANATNITNLTSTVAANKTEAANATAAVQANVDTLSNTVAANKTAIEGTVADLTEKVEANETAISGLQSSKADKTTVDALDAAYKAADAAMAEDIADAESRIKDLEDAIGTGSGENSLSSRVEALESTTTDQGNAISSLQTKMSTAEGKISTLVTDLDAAEVKIAANESNISTNTTNISALQTRAGQIEAAATTLTGRVDEHDTALATINTTLAKKANQTDLEQEITDRKAADEALQKNIDSVSNTVAGHTTKIAALESKDSELADSIADVSTSVTSLSNTVSAMDTAYKAKDAELEAAIKDLDDTKAEASDLTAVANRVTTLEGEMSDAKDSIADNANAITALSNSVAATYVKITDYDTKMSALDAKDASHDADIATLKSDVSGIKTAANTLAGRVTTNENNISSNTNAITALQTRMSTAESDIVALEAADEAIRAEIDSKFKAADAMTFKGEVADADDVSGLTGVEVGDTYVATDSFVLNENVVAVGDLIIASGTEGDDGKLTSVTWIHVPSGYVEAHENKLLGVGSGVQLQSHTGAGLGSLTFEAAANTAATVNVDISNPNATKVVIGMEWGSF